jgi:stress response protein YsnF
MTETRNERTGEKLVEEQRIPVVEERLVVDKAAREGRTITVRSRPVSEEALVEETLRRETIDVNRVPVNRVVEEVPAIREEGNLTIVPVVEERLVVRKELVLVEELHLSRHVSTETARETVPLSRTEVTVEAEDSPHSR